MARIIVGVLIILVGLSALTGLELTKFFIAIVIIAIGVRILTGRRFSDWRWNYSAVNTDENYLNEVAIFSAVNKVVKSQSFKGGKIVTIFAGGTIDLREAVAENNVVNLEFVAIFGGGKIIVPKIWRVNSQGTAIVGGFHNSTEAGTGETTFNLKGAAIFGGVDVLN